MDLGDYPRRATDWLSELDEDALGHARSVRRESVIDAGIGLLGLALLGWSPFPMLIFMVLSLWLRLFEMLIEWMLDRRRLQESFEEKAAVARARSLVREARDGAARERDSDAVPALKRLGVQLAIAFYLVGAFSLALAWELANQVGLSLGALLLERPDMLLIMGGLVAWRLFGLQRHVRRPSTGASWLTLSPPLLEAIMFPLLILPWMILSAIGVQLASLHGGDPQYVSALVFVVCGYTLIIWRAYAELRELPELKEDLRWLAERA